MISAGIMHTPSQKNSGGLLAGIFRSITARGIQTFHTLSQQIKIPRDYTKIFSTHSKSAGVDGLMRLRLDISHTTNQRALMDLRGYAGTFHTQQITGH